MKSRCTSAPKIVMNNLYVGGGKVKRVLLVLLVVAVTAFVAFAATPIKICRRTLGDITGDQSAKSNEALPSTKSTLQGITW